MARWVLPVLVGPSTAVTPAPRRRPSRVTGDENEIGIRFPGWGGPLQRSGHAFVYHNATPDQRALNAWERVWNEPGPNRRLRRCTSFVHRDIWLRPRRAATTSGSEAPPRSLPKPRPIVNDRSKRPPAGESIRRPPNPVDNLWITGKPEAAPQAITAALTASWCRPPRRAAAPPRRTAWPASRRRRSASGSRSGYGTSTRVSADRRQPDLHVALARPDI